MTATTQTVEQRISTRRTEKLWASLLLGALGGFILWGVGFAPGIAHNAAHDTRHVQVFPCH